AAAFSPGGKGANQAVAAARLGAAGRMVGCVGDDEFGRALRAALGGDAGADDGVRTVPGGPTGLAMITGDEAGGAHRHGAPGASREVGEAEIAAIADMTADVLVISAEVPVAAIRAALAARGRALGVLNLAPAPPEAAELVAAGVDWLVVNESEAAAVLGRPVAGLGGAARAAADLARAGARNAVGTPGAAGAAYRGPREDAGGPDGALTVPGFQGHAGDTLGAGDTVVGALAAAGAAAVP